MLHSHLDYWMFSLLTRAGDAVGDHAARPARPAGTRRDVRSDAGAGGVHLRRAAQAAAERQLRRAPSSRPAGEPADAAAGARRATSPSSAASRRRSGPTAPSPSRARAGIPLKIAAKVDRVDQEYFDTRHQADARRAGRRDDRRDRRRREAGVPQRRARRCCCRSTGPSRSAW